MPVITIIGLQLGGLMAFSHRHRDRCSNGPAWGCLLVQSVAVADIPVMSAYLLLIALVFVVINLVVDLLYYAVDPRLRIDRGACAVPRRGCPAMRGVVRAVSATAISSTVSATRRSRSFRSWCW